MQDLKQVDTKEVFAHAHETERDAETETDTQRDRQTDRASSFGITTQGRKELQLRGLSLFSALRTASKNPERHCFVIARLCLEP